MKKSDYLPFEEARKFVRSLGLCNSSEWREYCYSGKRPNNISVSPERIYKGKFISISDFIGEKIGFDGTYLSFEKARKFVRALSLRSQSEWRDYCKSGKKPHNIPNSPRYVYKDKWVSSGDFLGTGTIASQNIKFLSFQDARKVVRTFGLKSMREWKKYKKKPKNIPYKANIKYKNEGWKGWQDFLGYEGNLDFEGAREFVRKLSLKSNTEWKKYCKKSGFPHNLYKQPSRVYKNKGWKGWKDFLGYD